MKTKGSMKKCEDEIKYTIANKTFAVLMIFLALTSISFASLNPKIELEKYTLSEVPTIPGHVVNLTLQLRSVETDNCAERVSVQVSMSYPLSNQGPDTQYLGDLCAQDAKEKGRVSFLIPIDSLAESGTYPITVATTYEKRFSKFSESNTLNVRVGGEPDIIATVASSNPQDIYPGDTATISIKLHNSGSSRAESVIANLQAQKGIEVKWAGKTQTVGAIGARQNGNAEFVIEAEKDAKPGDYTLTLNLQYAKEDKSKMSESINLVLPLKQKAEFKASAKSDKLLAIGEDETVIITLENTGTKEAKKVKVKIKPIFPFSTDGTVRYIDSIKPGESADLEYLIHVDKEGTPGTQLSSLLIDFEDSQGKTFSDTQDFSLTTRTRPIIEKIIDIWYVWVLAAIMVVFFAGKKLTAKKKA
ncbi:MAG: CARDB domain-containing protein [Candidatus Micrarchaeia archaeon]